MSEKENKKEKVEEKEKKVQEETEKAKGEVQKKAEETKEEDVQKEPTESKKEEEVKKAKKTQEKKEGKAAKEEQKEEKAMEPRVPLVEGMLGRKIGMSQMFEKDGTVIPITLLKAGPCIVVQRKTKENDGYDAVQIGLVEVKSKKKAKKPIKGHFDKAGVPPTKILREFRIEKDATVAPGDKILVSLFQGVDKVHITGISKGLGFTGVIKRHHFSGGKASHGSMSHRAPGSIGASSFPSRVFKGMKMGGREGNKSVTVHNLKVVHIDEEQNMLAVRGSVPGAMGSPVIIKKSRTVQKAET
jgi:large subunit ribosomal protein L3